MIDKTIVKATGVLMALGVLVGSFSDRANAADWSITEMQLQYGNLDNPFLKTDTNTQILTIDHASGYSWGDVYFFADIVDDGENDGLNDKDIYAEGYVFFSSAKLLGRKYSGLIKDIGVYGSSNYAADANYLAWYSGVYADLNVPGFTFLRAIASRVYDQSDFDEKDGFHAGLIWAYPFELGNQRFLFNGHFEYMTREENNFGPTHDWFLAQPQLRWDVGYALTGKKDVVYVGTEYQYWVNKLGTEETESAFQALAVWRF